VTPENIAKHIAKRCACDVIVDGFCGAGGNTIQFAFTCKRVIAVDIDPVKVELARHNARIYGVEGKIEFIVGDFFHVIPSLKADVVFLSPPWGGPAYTDSQVCHLATFSGVRTFRAASVVSPSICYFLPKNTNIYEVAGLVGPRGRVEVEQHLVNGKLKTVAAYFGSLVSNSNS